MDVYTALQNDAGLQQRNPAHCADDTGCAKPIGLAAAAAQCLSAVCTGTCICYIPQKQVLGNAIESMDSNTLPTYAVQIKQGDPREAASLASALLTTGQPLEVLHFGFQLLQAVVSQWTIPITHTQTDKLESQATGLLQSVNGIAPVSESLHHFKVRALVSAGRR